MHYTFFIVWVNLLNRKNVWQGSNLQSYHNNHLALSVSAHLGLMWREFDPGFWIINFLKNLGLTSDINVPSKNEIRLKMEKNLESRES